MVSLSTAKDFQPLKWLPFCYVCGKEFCPGDIKDTDHVPSKKTFDVSDRSPPLCLPTHKSCNASHSPRDQKVGQLIALRRGQLPSKRDRQLKVKILNENYSAITNLDLREAIWSWIRGFHAALYREALPPDWKTFSIETPLPSGKPTEFRFKVDPILPQHLAFVEIIKKQRMLKNIDSIKSNNKQLIYECVWHQNDEKTSWMCVFALDLYDWKELGIVRGLPTRGCAGFYTTPSNAPPEHATTARASMILPLNSDRLDPFSV